MVELATTADAEKTWGVPYENVGGTVGSSTKSICSYSEFKDITDLVFTQFAAIKNITFDQMAKIFKDFF